MADTLLFRGGSSADITASTVQKRELVIDTGTDQIVSGPSKKKTVMEDSNGDVGIGGTLPSAPAISLNSDGSAQFADGDISMLSDGQLRMGRSVTDTSIGLMGSASGFGGTALQVFNSSTFGSGNRTVTIGRNGSTEFAGLMQVGLNPTNTSTYVQLNPDKGLITVRSSQGSSAAFSVLQADGTGNASAKINGNGSALFTGSVSIGGTAAANTIDEYEEGTCTPDFNVGGVAAGLTGGNAEGTYTRIGNLVTVQINLVISAASVSGLTGFLTITGLPFASKNTTASNYSSSICLITNWAADYKNGSKTITAINSANSTSLGLYVGDQNTGRLDETALSFTSGNCKIFTTFTYRIA